MAFTRDLFGRLDILDNNAAYHGDVNDGDVLSMTVELWDKIMSVNARGAMLMCKHALPLMIAQGGGSIINISSGRSEEHTSELQSLMRISYAVFCLKTKKHIHDTHPQGLHNP